MWKLILMVFLVDFVTKNKKFRSRDSRLGVDIKVFLFQDFSLQETLRKTLIISLFQDQEST